MLPFLCAWSRQSAWSPRAPNEEWARLSEREPSQGRGMLVARERMADMIVGDLLAEWAG